MVPHAFVCLVIVCLASHMIIFGRGEQANAVSEGYSEWFHKKTSDITCDGVVS